MFKLIDKLREEWWGGIVLIFVPGVAFILWFVLWDLISGGQRWGDQVAGFSGIAVILATVITYLRSRREQ